MKFRLKKSRFPRRVGGYVLILVAISVPVFLWFVNYSVSKLKLDHKTITHSSAAYAVGAAVLHKYNPGKTWSVQKNRLYSAGAQALCDRGFDLRKDMIMTPSTVKVYSKSHLITPGPMDKPFSQAKMYFLLSSYGLSHEQTTNFDKYVGSGGELITKNSLLCDDLPLNNAVINPKIGSLSFDLYATSNGKDAYEAVYYADDPNKLVITIEEDKERIKCDCKHLKKVVYASPSKCNVDIILAFPTNHAASTTSNDNSAALVAPDASGSTPITEIARAYSTFLENFLHVSGVAVGVVPYSGKISIPPHRTDWTVDIPPMNTSPSLAYMKQAIAYGTDGHEGGEIIAEDEILYDWGDADMGFPIMFRRGTLETYRDVKVYDGKALLSTDDPLSKSMYLFQRMNMNPCYLGHCNLLGRVCEKNCPTYKANPYFITELTDDVQSVIHDFSLIKPVDDSKNKSNFLFLAINWAHNLLSDWTAHPKAPSILNEKFAHPAPENKKKAIVIVVNAPDNFEPQELTYLGFNNDNSEIPMIESETIMFQNGGYYLKDGDYYGTKGILKYSTTDKPEITDKGLEYKEKGGTATVTVLQPGMIKVTVDLVAGRPWVEFYADQNITQNIGKCFIYGERTFVFDGPRQVNSWIDGNVKFGSGSYTTGGLNFGHNLSIKKIKYKSNNVIFKEASLTDQVLRFYGTYDPDEIGKELKISKPLIENTDGHCGPETNAVYERRTDPCICLEGSGNFYNKNYNQVYNNAAYKTINAWTWGESGDSYYINAYNLYPTCYGLKKGSKFVMAAANFPYESVIYGDKTLKTYNGSWQDTYMDISTKAGFYRVFTLDYNYGTLDNVCLFAGKFQYKRKEEHPGSYVSRKDYSRSGSMTMRTSSGGDKKGCYQSGVAYGDNRQVWLRSEYCCNKGGVKCGCDGDYYCYVMSGGSTADSGWYRVGNYQYNYREKNCANIASGKNGCEAVMTVKRSPTCYRTYNSAGDETYNDCGARDTLTHTGDVSTTVNYTITCDSGGNCTAYNPQNVSLSSQYISWKTVQKQYEDFPYRLNNFFFVNVGNVPYSTDATLEDILANKNCGTLTDEKGDNWFCFCGDGNFEVTFESGHRSLAFRDISDSEMQYTTFEDSTRSSFVTSNMSFYVTDKKEFYLNTDQLTKKDANGNCYFTMEVEQGLRVVSVELTNRKDKFVQPVVEVYEEGEATPNYDCAVKGDGSTAQVITFRTTTKASFNVNVVVPYSWLEETDFRQISKPVKVYSNSDKHSIDVDFISPPSSLVTRLSNEDFPNSKGTCTITAERKLASFILSGNYDYVKQETWTKFYDSRIDYSRLGSLQLTATAVPSTVPNTSNTAISPSKSNTSNSVRSYGSNNQVWAETRCSCSSPRTYYVPTDIVLSFWSYNYRCDSYTGCPEAYADCSYDYGIEAGSGWELEGATRKIEKLTNGSSYREHYYWSSSACRSGYDYDYYLAKDIIIGCTGMITFSRDPNCYRIMDLNGKITEDTCYATDELREGDKVVSTDDCIRNYDNERKALNTCPNSVYGSSYNRDPEKDVPCKDPWSFSASNFTDNNWSDSFGAYTCPVEIPANVFNLQLSDPVELYQNSCFNDVCAALGSRVRQNILAVDLEKYSDDINCHSYSTVATNCTLELASRTVLTGAVGNVVVKAQKSNTPQSVTISPEEFNFEIEGTGYYLVKVPCQNVYISSVKMLDETPFLRYTHPNLMTDGIKNVRIIDFNKNNGGKPQSYGHVTFEAVFPKYEIWNHLKFWTIYDKNNYIRPTDSVVGDYFLQIMDHENNVPGLEWKFPHYTNSENGRTGYGSDSKYYEEYAVKYLFSGLHRVFLPYGEFEKGGAGFDMLDSIKASLVFGGLTLNMNYVLCNNNYQISAGDNEIVPSVIIPPETALTKVASDAYRKLQNDFPNAKIYIIKYKTKKETGFDSCASNIYFADSESELNERLEEVAKDIKSFAQYRDALVDET
ncbi:MAG: hypothetical protein LBQ08_02020 [Holosporaceae bacterium]|jgi:hypothetical protein|nr:hypothetical protein [Holosporaceae bacterium]